MTVDVFRLDELHQIEASHRRAAKFRAREATGGRGTVYQQAERFRRQLDRLERGAAREVLEAWSRVRASVDDEIRRLTRLLDADPDDAAAIQRAVGRLSRSRDRVVATVGRYAEQVGEVVTVRQRAAAGAAQNANSALVAAQLPPGHPGMTMLDAGQVEQLLGQLRSGAFARTMSNMGRDFANQLQQELIDGMALGRSPRDVARRIGTSQNVPRWRALTIARTETLRAYREVSRRQMERNVDVVAGWTWLSQADIDTCAFCWSMHGQHFSASESMATHPNCKCSQAPRSRSWAELGFDDIDEPAGLQVEDGRELFDRQPERVQRAVLGPGKFQAYQDGQIGLADLAGFRHDPDWGRVGFERPLRDLLARA
jgi:SPP1 gp7 family putative phage head morphogenesis protein